MNENFDNAEISAFENAVQRIGADPQFRDLVLQDLPAAMRQVGLELPDMATIRQSLVEAGLPAEDLDKFDRATPEQVERAMSEGSWVSEELVTPATTGKFYRGVPGYKPAAHWWGYHIPFAYADIDDITKVGEALAGLVSTLGGFIAVAAPAIKPFVLALMLWVVAQTVVIMTVCAGCRGNRSAKGVWISAAWITPVVFVPTCVF